MSKIDEKKEYIGLLKTYMSIITALILAMGVGISKLYLSGDSGLLFWVGSVLIILMFLLFSFIIKKAHKEVQELRNL